MQKHFQRGRHLAAGIIFVALLCWMFLAHGAMAYFPFLGIVVLAVIYGFWAKRYVARRDTKEQNRWDSLNEAIGQLEGIVLGPKVGHRTWVYLLHGQPEQALVTRVNEGGNGYVIECHGAEAYAAASQLIRNHFEGLSWVELRRANDDKAAN